MEIRKTKKPVKATKKPSNHDHATQPRNHDTTVSRYHDTIIELVRKAVKELGKEAATHRFTMEEKKTIADIIYSYKNRGIRTSENEVTRIAVNFIINDYKENGENSILDKMIKGIEPIHQTPRYHGQPWCHATMVTSRCNLPLDFGVFYMFILLMLCFEDRIVSRRCRLRNPSY